MKPTIAMLMLAVAGCSRPPPNAVPTTTPAAAVNEVQADASLSGIVTVDGGKPAPGVPVAIKPRVSQVRAEAHAFPTAFQGKWGLTHVDCDLSRVDDATGAMSIDAQRVHFYEGSAAVRAMPVKSAYDLVADLELKGKDTAWQRRERFVLQTAGIALVRTEPASGTTPARSFRYERC